MNNPLTLALILALSGCSLTPEQQRAIASGMQSSGQALNQQAAEMRQRQHELNLQMTQQNQYQIPRQTNCITTYSAMLKEYQTSCN